MTIFPRRPPHGDVTQIPTPPLQSAGLFINFFFPALALVVVCLRSYSRLSMRQWGIDDSLMLIALMFSLLMCGPFYMHIKLNYYGWRQVDVPEFDPSPGQWWFFLAQLFYNPILAFVKASILMFLLRLGGHQRNIRYSIYGLNTFNALQGIAIFLVALLQCLPISANWDPVARGTATCVDVSFHVCISCLTVLTDILVLVLPFWIFLGLKLPMATKIAVIGVFMLGLSVTIIAIVRLVELYRLFYVPNPNADPYYNIGITLSIVEANVAIISASIPALRPLFRAWMPGVFSSADTKYGTQRKSTHMKTGGQATYNGTANSNTIAMRSMRRGSKGQHTECRGVSPDGSQEEIMTYNGILRSTDVRVQFDCEVDGRSLSRDSTGGGDMSDKPSRL